MFPFSRNFVLHSLLTQSIKISKSKLVKILVNQTVFRSPFHYGVDRMLFSDQFFSSVFINSPWNPVNPFTYYSKNENIIYSRFEYPVANIFIPNGVWNEIIINDLWQWTEWNLFGQSSFWTYRREYFCVDKEILFEYKRWLLNTKY